MEVPLFVFEWAVGFGNCNESSDRGTCPLLRGRDISSKTNVVLDITAWKYWIYVRIKHACPMENTGFLQTGESLHWQQKLVQLIEDLPKTVIFLWLSQLRIQIKHSRMGIWVQTAFPCWIDFFLLGVHTGSGSPWAQSLRSMSAMVLTSES